MIKASKVYLSVVLLCMLILAGAWVVYTRLPDRSLHIGEVQPSLQLVAWGNSEYGQLGIGRNYQLSEQHPYILVPIPENSKQVVAGISHSFVVTADGQVLAWGNNEFGQLGLGTAELVDSPQPLPDLPQIKQLASSQFHTLALAEDGSVWAWGLNGSGQLGDGTYKNKLSPTKVALSDVKLVGTGYRMSWAVKNDGSLWVWGGDCQNNTETNYAEVLKMLSNAASLEGTYFDEGLGSITEKNEAANCLGERWLNILSNVPVQIAAVGDIKEVSAGFGHMLILKNDGTVWSWGCNKYGQLGLGHATNNESVKQPQQVVGLPIITTISAGFRHSVAVDEAGNVWAWGHNHRSEIATTGKEIVATAQQIADLTDIVHVDAGQEYTLALDTDGKLWGWGENGYQTLLVADGENFRPFSSKPLAINHDLTFNQVSAGGGHVLAVSRTFNE